MTKPQQHSTSADFSYHSDLNGGSLMVRESRVVADLLLNEVLSEEWTRAIITNNVLQKRSPNTANRFGCAIRSRLQLLDPDFWRALRDGDDELATQISFVAALQRNLFSAVIEGAYIETPEQAAQFLAELKQRLDVALEQGARVRIREALPKQPGGQSAQALMAPFAVYRKNPKTL